MDRQNSARSYRSLSAVLCGEETHKSNAGTEQLIYRLDSIERAIAELHTRMDSQFRWLVGIQITTLIALGSLLFSILSKLPG